MTDAETRAIRARLAGRGNPAVMYELEAERETLEEQAEPPTVNRLG